jgi:hypothetical protein
VISRAQQSLVRIDAQMKHLEAIYLTAIEFSLKKKRKKQKKGQKGRHGRLVIAREQSVIYKER